MATSYYNLCDIFQVDIIQKAHKYKTLKSTLVTENYSYVH